MRYLVLLFFMISCSSSTKPFGVASENTWFLEKDVLGQISPIYCLANTDGKSEAQPVCYKALKK